MQYFSHAAKPNGRVWSLFSELSEASSKELVKKNPMAFSHTLEIVSVAMNNCLDETDFNLVAYEYGCAENDKIKGFRSAKKELFIVDDYSEDEEGKRVGFGDVSMRKLGRKDINFDAILDNCTFDICLQRLLDLRESITVNYGVDIVCTLKNSLQHVETSVELLQEVCEKDKQVKEVVEALCATAKDNLYSTLETVA